MFSGITKVFLGLTTVDKATKPRRRRNFAAPYRPYPVIFRTLFMDYPVQYCRHMLNGLSGSLESYLDLLSVRQKLIASNIANVDTPGYKTRDVDFQTEFQSLMDGGQSHATEVTGLKTNNDGNNVSLDREARLLSENGVRFSAVSQLLRGQIRLMKSAIDEGKNG